ncbi:hypothetical protein [Bacillus sp. CGMCC 1.16541]|uniref:hypothetical protein n=1 Tax=Bacillus sp. CGMCC 1.16541 TaxID=2185143 RepID=UPI000D73B306|nr:hypothetical protein [Bacillus sp. CGMCC 1.16541]
MKERFLSTETYTNQVLKEWFQTGIDREDIRKLEIDSLINSFYCIIDSLLVQRFYYDSERYEQKINDAWTVFWSGVKA